MGPATAWKHSCCFQLQTCGLFFLPQHETAEGGTQAIRIKRYTESVFLPVRKLGGVGASKGKVRRVFTSLLFPLESSSVFSSAVSAVAGHEKTSSWFHAGPAECYYLKMMFCAFEMFICVFPSVFLQHICVCFTEQMTIKLSTAFEDTE